MGRLTMGKCVGMIGHRQLFNGAGSDKRPNALAPAHPVGGKTKSHSPKSSFVPDGGLVIQATTSSLVPAGGPRVASWSMNERM
jgi:hypothetical protein